MTQPTYQETLAFIRGAHAGQVDKAGEPSWHHPHTVAVYVREMQGRDGPLHRYLPYQTDEVRAALLHDVVEDTPVTLNDLRDMGYGGLTIDIVNLLTRTKGDGLTYIEHIRRIAGSCEPAAVRVKLADLAHNRSPARLGQLDEKTAASLAKRYDKAKAILEPAYRKALEAR